jgi:hypothetical protein
VLHFFGLFTHDAIQYDVTNQTQQPVTGHYLACRPILSSSIKKADFGSRWHAGDSSSFPVVMFPETVKIVPGGNM